jgi:ribosomal protein S18 acetylase RimI-like enzyme
MRYIAHMQLSHFPIRPAQPGDNAALIRLFTEAPIVTPSLSYALDRGPDYWALAQLQGEPHILAAGDPVLGTLSVLGETVMLDGQVQRVAYTADLRVAPSGRGTGLADALMRAGIETARQAYGEQVPIFTCVMADNLIGLKKNANLGRDGVAHMQNVATFELAIVLPLSRPARTGRWQIRPATAADAESTWQLWQRVNQRRHLARVYPTLERWVQWWENTPGLGWENMWLAERQGQVCAFAGLWDQRALRRLQVTGEPALLRRLRPLWNRSRRLLRLPALPQTGEPLPVAHVVHLCVAPEAPLAFTPLLKTLLHALRKRNLSLLGLALDLRDPLYVQLRSFARSSSSMYLLSSAPPRQPAVYHLEIGLG